MLTNAEVTRLLDVANAGINKGQIALARTVYEGILAGRPDHAPTLISLALSHIAVSDFERADESFATRCSPPIPTMPTRSSISVFPRSSRAAPTKPPRSSAACLLARPRVSLPRVFSKADPA